MAALVVPLAAFPYCSGLFWGGGARASQSAMASTPAAAQIADAFLDVEGMTCEGCAVGIQATLAKKVSVSSVTEHFEEKLAHVVYDPSRVSVEQLTESIAELGFTATPRKDG